MKSLKATLTAARVRCAGESRLEMGGESFVPDGSKAYFEFWCAHSFPVVTTDGTALHPAVVDRSFRSMRHQVINLGHLMEAYGTSERDRTLGSVVAVEFPEMPSEGWRVTSSIEASPGIHGIGVLHRACQGVPRILEMQHSGERSWAVSMEIEFYRSDSAFLVRNDWLSRFGCQEGGPDDLRRSGWSACDFDAAPIPLQNTLLNGMPAVGAEYQPGVVFLAGGLRGNVHFSGLALTLLGKEPTAKAGRFTAAMELPVEPEKALPHLRRVLELLP